MDNERSRRATVVNPAKNSDGILPKISSVHTEPYTNYIIRLLFEASPDGFFTMMLSHPVEWDPEKDDPVLFDHIFKTQQITIFNKRATELNPGFHGNLMGVSPERYFYYDVKSGRSAWKKLLKTGWLHLETSEEISPGMMIWIETEFVNIYDNNGLLLGCFASQRDFSHRYYEIDSLTKSNKDLGSTISAIGDPLIMIDKSGIVTYLNYAAEVTLDLTYDQFVNKKITDIVQIDDLDTGQNLKSILEQVKVSGLNFRLGNTARLKYGIRESSITGVISSVKADDESHIGWVLLLRYPGEVQKEFIEDRVNYERMSRLNKLTAMGNWEIDLNHGKVWISDDIFDLFGIRRVMRDDPEELKFLQTKMNEMIVVEDREKVEKAATVLINEFKGYSVDYRIIDPETKKIRYIRSVVEVSLDNSGNPAMITGVAHDLTWYYDEISKSSFFKEIIDQAPVGIVVTDPSGIIKYINKRIADITGYTPEELLGQKPSIFKSGVLPVQFYENLWKVVLSGEIWQGDIINKKKDGSHYWDSASISGVKDKDGAIDKLVAFKQDVSGRKKLESEIKKQKEQLDLLHKEKISILESLGLEIRNPLNGINGFLDVLISEVTDYNQRKLLKSIKNSAERVIKKLESVANILDMEKGSWRVNMKLTDIGAALQDIFNFYREMAEEKGLRFDTYVQEGIEVVTDGALIAKATGNLLDNAVRYTSSGSIRVEVMRTPGDSDELLIRVTDTGPGIKREIIDSIFRDSISVSPDLSKLTTSSGFGLKITKEILKKLGGTIKIESVPGKRTSLTIVLQPDGVITEKDNDQEMIDQFRRQNKNNLLNEILLVEDSKINSDVIALYLRRICNVDSAKNSEVALKMAGEKQYSAVIMDINLGNGMDGVDTMKKMRAIPEYSSIPFIAVTGYALNSDKMRIIDEGFDFFFTKPLDMAKFALFIQDLLVSEDK